MSIQAHEIITEYEVLFAARTGVTVMVPVVTAFNGSAEKPISFEISPENPRDIIINANNKPVVLKGMKKDYLDAAISRGFIMFYEMKDDEIVRSTLCNYQKKQ
jgi:hypothetical protein